MRKLRIPPPRGISKASRVIFSVLTLLFLSIEQVWGAWEKASSIAAGDVVVFVNESNSKELTGLSTTSTVYGIASDYTTTPAGTFAFTVEAGSSEGTFSFKNGDKYLNWSSGNSLTTATTKSANSSWTVTFSDGNVNVANANTSNRKLVYNSSSPRFACYTSAQQPIQIYKQADSSEPNVSADPAEVTDVVAAGVTNETIDLTYENIENYETEVSVHPNADGTGTLSPAWLTASVSDADDYATVTYSVSANEGAARTAYIKVYTTDGDAEAETIIPVSQVKYSAPTGTFELFSGALEEGEYIICSGTNALKNTATSSPRIEAATVTISENKIEDPDESLVWKIEALTGDDDGYWTFYNKAGDVYAAFTSTNARGNVIASVTNYAKWTTEDEGPSYDFTNKGLTSKYLRFNDGYGFASYATSTGEELTLYKKQVAGQPKAPTFSVPGGNYENAQSVELSCETQGAKIYYTLDGSKPSSTSTEYSAAIPVSATTTIKAVAIKDEIESTVATATYTIVVWQTVADVWDDITSSGPTNAHIYGYVSQTNVGGYANNFYISDNGSTEGNQLYAYRMDMNSYSVEKGDKVKLAGDLTLYNDVKEFKYTSADNCGKVIALEAKGALQSVAVSGTPTKTEYASGEDFDPAGLKVYGTYANGFVGEITEGITWGNDLTDGKVTENTTVHVTATVSGQTSPAYDVPVTVAAKTLVSIAVGTASYTIYTGEVLPKPVVTATFSEGDPEDVSTFAVYDTESVFDTEVIDDPDPQTITVSYTFGGATEIVAYTVSVKDYANANDAPYTVTEALHIITDAIGSTESAREIVVVGTVNEDNISNNKNRYKISDGVNELLVYAGKGFNNETFTNTNYPKVGDVVKVKGKVINYNNNTPEFASGKSYLLSQVRPATIAIENVASFEVGATDLTENDLDITTPSDGDITFVSGDDAVATIVANVAIHAVAPGTVTITANLAATENVDALNYAAASTTFNVTVIAAQVKYAITFDDNGADGGSAPDAIADKAAGVAVTLPASSYTKTGYTFTGWKVYDENEDEVTVTANAFEMPASPVTIKAQWAEIPVWAYTYTSNVTLTGAKVKFYGEETEYDAVKAGTGSVAGSTSITVPAQATKLHFHAYGWNTENVGLTVTAPTGVTVSPATEISINKNAGIKDNSPFTLAEGSTPMTDAYYVVELSGNDDEIELTFTATSGKRFVLFGVNQEGGIEPELDHITITGELTNKDYELGDELDKTGLTVTAYYTLAGVAHHNEDVTSDVVWSNDPLTGGQTSVDVTATYGGKSDTKACAINAVVVPTPEIILSESALEFSGKQYGAVANKTFNVTLKNVAAATIALSGDDAAKFSIDPAALTANGTVTVSVANTNVAGSFSATITVSDDAAAAAAQTVALTLTITADEAPAWNAEWVEATELYDGMPILITGVNSTTGKTYAVGAQNSNNRAAVEASVDGNGVLTPGTGTKQFTLEVVDAENNQYAIKTSDGKYLYAAGSGSGKNYLRSQATNDDNGVWTLTTTSAEANGTNTNKYMKFNTSGMFSCYSSGQTAIKLYTPKSYTRTVSGNYGTICLPKAGVMTNGVLYEISYYDADQKKIFFDEVEGGVMVAGAPYIFKPNENVTELKVAYTDVAVVDNAGHKNGLYGHYDLNNPTEGAEAARLFLTNGDYFLRNNEYWLVDQEDRVYVDNYRAYIKLDKIGNDVPPQAYGRRRVAMNVNGEQVATGMDELNASEAPVKMMINGQLFILRGEKLYDTTGRLVK